MTIIYRIQDTDGRGPWKPGFGDKWVINRNDHENLLPIMQEFDLRQLKFYIKMGFHVGCGCPSLSLLKRWIIAEEYVTLKSYGYRAVSLKVDHVIEESKTQLIFARSIPISLGAKEIPLYKHAVKL